VSAAVVLSAAILVLTGVEEVSSAERARAGTES